MEQENTPHAIADGAIAAAGDRANIRAEDIVTEQVLPFGWKVRDRRSVEHDRAALIGLIEQVDDRFEVIQLGDDFRLLTFRSLDEAVQHLTSVATFGRNLGDG